MALQKDQIAALLKSPKNSSNIAKASQHEKRLNFHVETALDRSDVSYACNVFLSWVEQLIPKDKFLIFLSLFRFPVITNDLTEQIFNSLEKVFDGRDPFYDYEFTNDAAKADYLEYKKSLGGNKAWNQKAFNAMKQAINSFIIVDMDSEVSQGLPEPIYRFKRISTIHDYSLKHGEIEYLIYLKSDEQLICIDDESYKVYSLVKGELSEELINNPHGLDYCPVRFFWSDLLKDTNESLKKSPLSNQLNNLDTLLFKHISNQHLDLYASYPIIWMYEADCDYSTPMGNGKEGGKITCQSGFLVDENRNYQIDATGSVVKCPVCGEKAFAGAGSVIEAPLPDPEQNIPSVGQPVGIIPVEVNGLKHNDDKVAAMQAHIFTNVVGYGGDLPNDQAVNALQIAASFESRTAVIHNLKRNFEDAQEWTERTICAIRYESRFKDLSFNYGNTFYFMTAQELLSLYDSAKKSGASDAYLDSIQEQIIETQHRSNPIEMARAKVLLELEPYRHMTKQEVANLYQSNPSLINPVDLAIKLNFSNFITRFERENMPISEFGSNVPYDQKIVSIRQTLESYGQQDKNNTEGE